MADGSEVNHVTFVIGGAQLEIYFSLKILCKNCWSWRVEWISECWNGIYILTLQNGWAPHSWKSVDGRSK